MKKILLYVYYIFAVMVFNSCAGESIATIRQRESSTKQVIPLAASTPLPEQLRKTFVEVFQKNMDALCFCKGGSFFLKALRAAGITEDSVEDLQGWSDNPLGAVVDSFDFQTLRDLLALSESAKWMITAIREHAADTDNLDMFWFLERSQPTPQADRKDLVLHAIKQNSKEVLAYMLTRWETSLSIEQRLATAVKEGNCEAVKTLAAMGANLNEFSSVGPFLPMLTLAVFHNQPIMVDLLVTLGGDINVKGLFPYVTPLTAAAHTGNYELVSQILEYGPDVNGPAGKQTTALIEAVKGGNIPIVQLLLEGGADVNGPAGIQTTALIEAVKGGNIPIVQLLLEGGADVNGPAGIDTTALIEAVKGGNITIVQLLLEGGADVNRPVGKQTTALIEAVKGGNIPIVQLLLKGGPDVNGPAGIDTTALIEAVKGGYIPIVQLLLEGGADVNRPAGKQTTAIDEAVKGGNIPIVQLLLEKGAPMPQAGWWLASSRYSAGTHNYTLRKEE